MQRANVLKESTCYPKPRNYINNAVTLFETRMMLCVFDIDVAELGKNSTVVEDFMFVGEAS